MKVIVDDPNLKSQVIKTVRVFSCKNCKRVCPRKDVHKDVESGKYFCVHCNHEVEDITNRETGQSFIQVVGL